MKRKTVYKLLAVAIGAALCVPILLTNPNGDGSMIAFAAGIQTKSETPTDTTTPGGSNTTTPGGSNTTTPGGSNTTTPGGSTITPPTSTVPGDSNKPSDSNKPDDSSSSSSSDSSSSSSSSESSAAVTTSAGGTTVVIGGAPVKSSVGGIFAASTVTGTAITTPVANLAAAVGLSEAEVQAGTNIRSYICDNRDKASKAALQSAAEAAGKTVAGYVNMDLYSITKKGVVTKISTSTEPVTIAFGLPARFVKADRNFSILAVGPDGKAVIMDDVDTDPRTITINTKVFGAYSIVY